jgi:anti-sigma regulatory factor (Ser/Thr protein kinase)
MTDNWLELRRDITRDLGVLRALVRDYAAVAGLSGTRLTDLVMAVNEVSANVLEHGGGTGSIFARCDSDGVWVEITDTAGTLRAEHLRLEPGSQRVFDLSRLRLMF